jgi:SAM-dependent methyltransferase
MDLLACPSCHAFPLELSELERENGPVPKAPVQSPRCALFCSLKGAPVSELEEKPPCVECYSREIAQGILHCASCHQEWAVIDGIPRFNPDAHSDFPEWFARHAAKFRYRKTADVETFRSLHKETKRSFGYQWLRYQVTDHQENREVFHDRLGTRPGSLNGQLLFEAGCGMGRYLQVIGEDPGAEAVGLDLSMAVNRAYRENRDNPLIHILQGNLMELPLRPGTFDHVYSIGVLHHTPSTKEAFRSVLTLAKAGGRVSIWVYHAWCPPGLRGFQRIHAGIRGWISENLRRLTTRMPLPLLHYLCYLAVPLGWVQHQIQKLPAPVRALLSPLTLPPVSAHPKWQVRLCDTFDWYSPRFQWKHTIPEVENWFREAGLKQIDSRGFPVSVRGQLPASRSSTNGNALSGPGQTTQTVGGSSARTRPL